MKIIQKIQRQVHNLILAKMISVIVIMIDRQGVVLPGEPFLNR